MTSAPGQKRAVAAEYHQGGNRREHVGRVVAPQARHSHSGGISASTENGISLPAMRKMLGEHPGEFEEQLAEWKRVLGALAEKFLAGLAEVDPKPGACDNCGLTALCRVRELERDR